VKTTSVSWANQVPRGEGLAYSLNAQRQQSDEGINLVLTPRLEWFTRYGTVSGEVTRFQGDNSRSTGYSVALSGALVATGRHFLATRPIPDSFAIVELLPPLAGVRVYENSQEVGRTDARGRVLLPNIASYAANYASIASTDVPIEYTIDSIGRTFSPSFRSGMVVPFGIARLRSFSGRFVSGVTGNSGPLEYHQVLLRTEGRTIEIPTAKNGEFYAENLPPGRHDAEVEINGIRCRFTLEIPATDASFVSLGDVMTCNAAR
jgi:outer membrane usher protein